MGDMAIKDTMVVDTILSMTITAVDHPIGSITIKGEPILNIDKTTIHGVKKNVGSLLTSEMRMLRKSTWARSGKEKE